MEEAIINHKLSKEVAECVGLWLAEGDDKCNNEITFTNNEVGLVMYFDKCIRGIFTDSIARVRLYIYTPNGIEIEAPIKVDIVRNYRDNRANKPYYIWRMASARLNKEWKNIVNLYMTNKDYYPDILRGFFAGEGSIKSTSHNSRSVMISQLPSIFLEKMLNSLEIEFNYNPGNRSYFITHWDNWDKLAKIKIADLHSIKKEKFWRIYSEYKERHYKIHHIRNSIFQMLITPHMTSELAVSFDRTEARIQDVLMDLKNKGVISNFKCGLKTYWIKNDQNVVIISKLKKNYLDLLENKSKNTAEIAKYFNVNFHSSKKRLKELERLELVKRNGDKRWEKLNPAKKVIVL